MAIFPCDWSYLSESRSRTKPIRAKACAACGPPVRVAEIAALQAQSVITKHVPQVFRNALTSKSVQIVVDTDVWSEN